MSYFMSYVYEMIAIIMQDEIKEHVKVLYF
jgi:hypothetical protein